MDNKSQQTPPKRPNISWLWWVAVLAMVAWYAYSLLPKSQPQVSLPYSTVLDQIRAGNVTQVDINGQTVNGVFKNPVTWPPATPVAGTATPGGSTASPSDQSAAPAQYSEFTTNFPDVIGDPNFIPLLEANNVAINVEPSGTPWFTLLLSYGLPIIIFVVVMVLLSRNASKSQAGIFNFGRSKARQMTGERPDVTFNDVAGADEAKQELQEVVDFLKNPKKYHDIGARIPRGVLLVGPPGTGKTLLARAVSGEAKVPFFIISASEFVEMFVGVGASRVRDLFEQAKKVAPAIVFIDEMDAVGRRRGAGLGTVNDEREQTLNQLLVEMDGFDLHHELIVLAATNRPDVLDPALLRPGRFDRQITVGLPDVQGREGILKIHTRKLRLSPEVNLNLLARSTTGFSGADLANLCNEAALNAARNNHTFISMVDFEEAEDRLLLGAARTLVLSERDRRVIAYHEAGHALIAWLTPEADPVHKVTIIPRGRALGVTEQLPGEDRYNYSKPYLMARLAVMLGGRSAEEIAIKEITTGAENDLMEATRLARRMVTRWGMGGLGPMALDTHEEQPFLGYEITQGREYSEETAARIDQNVQELLKDRYTAVTRLLSRAREPLDRLVDMLLHDETIDQEEIVRILGPRPYEPMDEVSTPVKVLQPSQS